MNYASALPFTLGMMAQKPFGAPRSGATKLGDLIGNAQAAQVAKLGDLQAPTAAPMPEDRPAAPGTMLAPPRQPGTLGALADGQPRLSDIQGGPLPRPAAMTEGIKLGDLVNEQPHHKGIKSEVLRSILGGLSDGLLVWSGREPMFAPMMMRQREREEDAINERNLFVEKWQAEQAAKREERLRPRVEQVGNTLGMLNPETQQFSPFYTAPQPFESYARALGYEPGSPEYRSAVEDYRLGAWSDPAMENKTELESLRYGNRRTLQNDRLAVTRRGQDMRSTDMRRGQDLTDARGRRGQDMTDKRVRDFHGKKVGGQPVSSNEPMTRLSNGHYAVVRGGRWVDASTGQPVQ